VAMLIGPAKAPVTWQLAMNRTRSATWCANSSASRPGPVQMCYEAGPCGYALQRQVTTSRVSCDVVAPALIPRKPGERVKTNRRDARKLAELGRAGLLTAVQPPTPKDEAVRDLARARDDAREDLQRGRHRLGKLLLRRGLHDAGRNLDARASPWLDRLTWTHAAERTVVDDYLLAIDPRGPPPAALLQAFRPRSRRRRKCLGLVPPRGPADAAEQHDLAAYRSGQGKAAGGSPAALPESIRRRTPAASDRTAVVRYSTVTLFARFRG
jgi:hypothetical protein